MEELVPFHKELDSYSPTFDYENQMQPVIDENDEDVFWNELSRRLANRDMAKEGKEYPTKDDAMMKFFEIEGEYEKEFIERGISNLGLVSPEKK
ncbi:hypothetical protein [Sporosarcina sp. A2]|uniref:hypothetical protein n=1 Tax=Sporosarcina sp. A2 TaxID=3393449 RepID=UPI003D7A93A8